MTEHTTTDGPTVGIITAMDLELRAILKHVPSYETVTRGHRTFQRWQVGGLEVVATVGGIGKVQAAAVTQILLDHFAPRAVINSGVAGALTPDLPPNTLVLGEHLSYHDFDLARFVPSLHPLTGDPHLLALAEDVAAARTSDVSEDAADAAGKSPELRRGSIVSGDCFVDRADLRARIAADSGADAVDMESAAIAQVAAAGDVPVLIIRTISDRADESAAHADWDAWAAVAAEHAAALCRCVLERLASEEAEDTRD